MSDKSTSSRISDILSQAKVTIELVSPKTAAEWLKQNLNNRKINDHRVAALVRQLVADRFNLSPDAIAFDSSNRLCNGQHRLTAIVRSGVAAPLIVLREAPTNTFLVTDIGMKKSGAHALHTLGYDGCTNLSAIARYVTSVVACGSMIAGLLVSEAVTPEEIVETVKAFPDLPRHHTDAGRLTSGHDKLACTRTSAALALWYAAEKSPEAHDELLQFLERAASGVGLDDGSAELALRRRLANLKHNKGKGAEMTREQVALIVKAFNRRNHKMTVLHWKETEAFPVID